MIIQLYIFFQLIGTTQQIIFMVKYCCMSHKLEKLSLAKNCSNFPKQTVQIVCSLYDKNWWCVNIRWKYSIYLHCFDMFFYLFLKLYKINWCLSQWWVPFLYRKFGRLRRLIFVFCKHPMDGNVLKLDFTEPDQHQSNKAKQQQIHCLQQSHHSPHECVIVYWKWKKEW